MTAMQRYFFFDKKENVVWDVRADYGIPFDRIKLPSGMECVIFFINTLCGLTEKDFSENGISIKMTGRETIVLGDGSSEDAFSYEVTRLGQSTRTFLSKAGNVVAFSLYADRTEWANWMGWINYAACDMNGALHLHELND